MDEAKRKEMAEKMRRLMKERWGELSLEERLETKQQISEGMKQRHRRRTAEERRAIALKAAETRRRNQMARAKEREE